MAHAGIAAPATVRINGTLNDDSMLLAPGTLAGTLVLTSGDGGFAPRAAGEGSIWSRAPRRVAPPEAARSPLP